MGINTSYVRRCLKSLELACEVLKENDDKDDVMRDVYRAACIKNFELVLEQSGKLLKVRLMDYLENRNEINRLTFKGIFRAATKYQLVNPESAERWFAYRDWRNDLAHKYGEEYAEDVLYLLPQFITDATLLVEMVENTEHE